MSASESLGRRVSHIDPESELDLLDFLGQGAYGAVRKARRRSNGQMVAVKMIPVEACSSAVSDLKKEIDMMSLLRSPYVVALHRCYLRTTEAWIVMDYCGGGSVDDIMESSQNPLSEVEVKCCAAWMVMGLQHLHEQHMMHRDLKAGNVLLTTDGKAKLADFGVSAIMQDGEKRGTVIGTPYWMAPEIIQELPYDFKADIWSLGITLIEMAEGAPPLSKVHPMRAIFMIPSKPPPKFQDASKWSKEFNEFVAACLVKDPEGRPTAKELLSHPWLQSKAVEVEGSNGKEGCAELQELVIRHMDDLRRYRAHQADKLEMEEGAAGLDMEDDVHLCGATGGSFGTDNAAGGRGRTASQCNTLEINCEIMAGGGSKGWKQGRGSLSESLDDLGEETEEYAGVHSVSDSQRSWSLGSASSSGSVLRVDVDKRGGDSRKKSWGHVDLDGNCRDDEGVGAGNKAGNVPPSCGAHGYRKSWSMGSASSTGSVVRTGTGVQENIQLKNWVHDVFDTDRTSREEGKGAVGGSGMLSNRGDHRHRQLWSMGSASSTGSVVRTGPKGGGCSFEGKSCRQGIQDVIGSRCGPDMPAFRAAYGHRQSFSMGSGSSAGSVVRTGAVGGQSMKPGCKYGHVRSSSSSGSMVPVTAINTLWADHSSEESFVPAGGVAVCGRSDQGGSCDRGYCENDDRKGDAGGVYSSSHIWEVSSSDQTMKRSPSSTSNCQTSLSQSQPLSEVKSSREGTLATGTGSKGRIFSGCAADLPKISSLSPGAENASTAEPRGTPTNSSGKSAARALSNNLMRAAMYFGSGEGSGGVSLGCLGNCISGGGVVADLGRLGVGGGGIGTGREISTGTPSSNILEGKEFSSVEASNVWHNQLPAQPVEGQDSSAGTGVEMVTSPSWDSEKGETSKSIPVSHLPLEHQVIPGVVPDDQTHIEDESSTAFVGGIERSNGEGGEGRRERSSLPEALAELHGKKVWKVRAEALATPSTRGSISTVAPSPRTRQKEKESAHDRLGVEYGEWAEVRMSLPEEYQKIDEEFEAGVEQLREQRRQRRQEAEARHRQRKARSGAGREKQPGVEVVAQELTGGGACEDAPGLPGPSLVAVL